MTTNGQLPQDLQAEQSVLGGMLLSANAVAEVAEQLRPDDFYQPKHRIVYDAILELHTRGDPVDAVTVAAVIDRHGKLTRIGGATYLHDLMTAAPPAISASAHAKIVADKALLRRLVETGTRIAQYGYAGADDVADVISRAQAEFTDAITASPKQNGQRVITWRTGQQIADRVPEWGWTYHGKGRLQRGTLCLFAGRPGAGKSTAARWFASGFSRGTLDGCFVGKPQNVAYIASEESREDVVKPSMRAHGANHALIHYPAVEMDGQEVRLLSAVDETSLTDGLLQRAITVVFVDPVMSAVGSKVDLNANNEVRAAIEPWARIARAINGLVIGIVHLVKAPGGDVVAAINGSSAFGEVARGIVAFAKDHRSDEGVRVLSQEKNSAGPEDLALTYTIVPTVVDTDDGKRAEVARFVIGELSDRRVSDVLQIDPRERNIANAGTKMAEVLDAVRSAAKPVTAALISHCVGLSTDDTGRYLRRLVDAGKLRKVGHGTFEYRPDMEGT